MILTTITLLTIAGVLSGLGVYGYRRVRKVWDADQERAAQAAATLLASLNPSPADPSTACPQVESVVLVEIDEDPALPEGTSEPAARRGEARPEVTIEEEMRAFFGSASPVGPTRTET